MAIGIIITRVAFTTLGCRFNQNETLEMEESLGSGFEIVSYSTEAEIYVINTCTVTGKSDYKCRQIIRNTFKRTPQAKIIVTGCYAETKKKEICAIPGVTLVVGNSEKANIKSLINGLVNDSGGTNRQPFSTEDVLDPEPLQHSTTSSSSRRTSAYLKIQTGCDMNCSYCIVTVARGRGRSKPVEQVKREFTKLVTAGANEIVLTGINLGCYGQELGHKASVASLLRELLAVKDVKRIRLSSINPSEVSDELIDLMQSNRVICRHLHIPLQSGDDDILRLMRRNYTTETFKRLVRKLHSSIEGIGIGTDVITGFPGESEQAFLNTYNLIEGLPLSYLHVFRYSKRDGTDASRFGGQIPNTVKAARSKLLIELGTRKKSEFRKRHLNRVVDVLFEAREMGPEQGLTGFSDNYIPVIVDGPQKLKNSIRPVRLMNFEAEKVRGVLQEQKM